MRIRGSLLTAALVTGTLTTGGPARALTCGTPALRARWSMDEAPGSRIMEDAVGGSDGTVRFAQTGETVPEHPGFGSFYRFGRGGAFPQGSLVTVPDTGDSLDPRACDFAVEIWVNWDRVTPDARRKTTFNVTQKGLSSAPANWKLEIDGGADERFPNGGLKRAHFGRAVCTFDGASDGRPPVKVESPAGDRVPNDGTWTKVRCERRGNDFLVRLNDGQVVKRTVAGVGPIANASSLTVGAKALNDSDTFPGLVDELSYWAG